MGRPGTSCQDPPVETPVLAELLPPLNVAKVSDAVAPTRSGRPTPSRSQGEVVGGGA
jgi:hypothetical protein